MLTQVSVYAIKRVNFGLKYQCFTEKKGSFLAEKSVFCHEKETNFQTGEQGWVQLFSVSKGAGTPFCPWKKQLLWFVYNTYFSANYLRHIQYSLRHTKYATTPLVNMCDQLQRWSLNLPCNLCTFQSPCRLNPIPMRLQRRRDFITNHHLLSSSRILCGQKCHFAATKSSPWRGFGQSNRAQNALYLPQEDTLLVNKSYLSPCLFILNVSGSFYLLPNTLWETFILTVWILFWL